jgi:ribonuclease HI
VNDNVSKIVSMVNVCSAAFASPTIDTTQSLHQRLVSWSCPEEGTVFLNVDGSMIGSTQDTGFGGLIRNNFGALLKGFYGKASHSSILFAEITAILHGLEICWVNGFRNLACYSNSLLAVTLISDGVSHHHKYANEIQSICHLLHRDWIVVLNHTPREGNACADVLAKMGASSNSPLVILEEPPAQLFSALNADARGVVFVREKSRFSIVFFVLFFSLVTKKIS